jgi:hypothetical protein
VGCRGAHHVVPAATAGGDFFGLCRCPHVLSSLVVGAQNLRASGCSAVQMEGVDLSDLPGQNQPGVGVYYGAAHHAFDAEHAAQRFTGRFDAQWGVANFAWAGQGSARAEVGVLRGYLGSPKLLCRSWR